MLGNRSVEIARKCPSRWPDRRRRGNGAGLICGAVRGDEPRPLAQFGPAPFPLRPFAARKPWSVPGILRYSVSGICPVFVPGIRVGRKAIDANEDRRDAVPTLCRPQSGMAGHPRAAGVGCNGPQALRQAWRGNALSSIGYRPWFHRPAGRSGTRPRSQCCGKVPMRPIFAEDDRADLSTHRRPNPARPVDPSTRPRRRCPVRFGVPASVPAGRRDRSNTRRRGRAG